MEDILMYINIIRQVNPKNATLLGLVLLIFLFGMMTCKLQIVFWIKDCRHHWAKTEHHGVLFELLRFILKVFTWKIFFSPPTRNLLSRFQHWWTCNRVKFVRCYIGPCIFHLTGQWQMTINVDFPKSLI